jgi:hypothetical protein
VRLVAKGLTILRPQEVIPQTVLSFPHVALADIPFGGSVANGVSVVAS